MVGYQKQKCLFQLVLLQHFNNTQFTKPVYLPENCLFFSGNAARCSSVAAVVVVVVVVVVKGVVKGVIVAIVVVVNRVV